MSDLLGLMLATERRRIAARIDGEGAWRREARALITAAARQGAVLPEAALIYYDVRDLQALLHRLESGHAERVLRDLWAA